MTISLIENTLPDKYGLICPQNDLWTRLTA